MVRSAWRLAVISIVLATCGSVAAQGVRLRPLAPIYVDGAGSSIHKPEGVGCGTNRLIVADSGNARLLLFDITGEGPVPAGSFQTPQLPRPVRAEIASTGEIFALDGKLRRIVRLDAGGQYVGPFEPVGLDAEMTPRSFKLDDRDRLWIIDLQSENVLVVGRDGAVERRIAFPESYGMISDLTVTSTGRVFAVDSIRKTVLSADGSAGALTELAIDLRGKADFPSSISADDSGNLYVGDLDGGTILVLGFDGGFRTRQSGFGWKPGLLRYPSSVCYDSSDRLFVADRENSRVQVFAVLR